MATADFVFPVYTLDALETNFGRQTKVVGTNLTMMSVAFASATEEYRNGQLQVPTDVDTSGTVTFRAWVWAATAAASKNVAFTFGHLALVDSDDWDPITPYTDEDSGDKAIDATQDNVSELTWTETVSNLGWTASDLVIWRISRPAAGANNLSGDMYWNTFAVEIPLA